jgi:hypothetical protein
MGSDYPTRGTTQQYVHVSSEFASYLMIYFIYHKKVHTCHYISIDVSSDDCSDSMIYYRHYTSMATPHYVCRLSVTVPHAITPDNL